MTVWEIGVVSEGRRIGSNPEMADMDNPTGDVYAMVFIVLGQAPDGSRRMFDMIFLDQDEAERFACTFDGDSPNHVQAGWVDVAPAYGSDAYARIDWDELQHAQEHEEF